MDLIAFIYMIILYSIIVYIVLFDISDCAWMGTINKWLHGVDGCMDAPPPPSPLPSAEPNLLFIFTALMDQNIVFFPIVLWLFMEMYFWLLACNMGLSRNYSSNILLRNFHDVQNRNNSEYSIADYFF